MNVLGSFFIPWFWAIGSSSLHLEHNLVTSLRLLMNGSFASISKIMTWFCQTISLMNKIKWVKKSDSLFRIVHCWVKAVIVLVGSMGPLHTLYTEINVTIRPSRPCSVRQDRLLKPWLSFPLFIFRDLNLLFADIAVPPGLYIESQLKLVSDVVMATPFQCCAIVFLKLSYTLFSSNMY